MQVRICQHVGEVRNGRRQGRFRAHDLQYGETMDVETLTVGPDHMSSR